MISARLPKDAEVTWIVLEQAPGPDDRKGLRQRSAGRRGTPIERLLLRRISQAAVVAVRKSVSRCWSARMAVTVSSWMIAVKSRS